MTNINRSRARRVLGGLALAAGTAAAYGITATGADVIPNNEDENAIDLTGLSPQRDGVYLAAID